MTRFKLPHLERLLQKAQVIADPNGDGSPAEGEGWDESGWTPSEIDPAGVVAVFAPRLKLRGDFVLRGWQYRSGNNGHGVVWALPVAGAVDALQLPSSRARAFEAPRPVHAVDDFMTAIEGDGSPRSYLYASLLARELAEFGAIWHGVYWWDHSLVDHNPFPHGHSHASDVPGALAPRVVEEGGVVTVTFHTRTNFGDAGLVRHRDVYAEGGHGELVATRTAELIVSGPRCLH